VASGGTGGGMRRFCEGVGPNAIDSADARRAMRPAGIEGCNADGTNDLSESMFGFDGDVFATRTTRDAFAREPRHVGMAISAALPDGMARPAKGNRPTPPLPTSASCRPSRRRTAAPARGLKSA
jgi:hypothetical protein